jgi:putative Holliday junction resolvase
VIGFDYGERRIGVALSDPLRITAQPVTVLDADDVAELRRILEEADAEIVVVGLPVHLSGVEGESAAAARAFGRRVSDISGLPVEFYDERFTSTIAERALLEAGLSRRDRRERRDMVAAAVMLQGYLDRGPGADGPGGGR